ncbi:MAG: PDZ domain-containing protein, partial [Rikenellaceae bacterium]
MKKIIFNLLAIILSTAPLATSQTKDEAAQQMQKFNLFYRYLTGVYLDELDTKPLVERAIREMLLELDPHSSYLTADELKSSKENMEGEFSGIGIEFSVQRDTIIVVNTIISAPAEAVGMRAGDRIIAIDGKSAIGFTQSDVPKHLKGKRGTKVKVEALRYGESEPLLFEITRDNIPITT